MNKIGRKMIMRALTTVYIFAAALAVDREWSLAYGVSIRLVFQRGHLLHIDESSTK